MLPVVMDSCDTFLSPIMCSSLPAACGPMFFGVVCFLIVHAEFETQMMGVLRGLGLRESVYWVSWWIPFSILAFVNAVLGAMTTQFFDVHAFQNIYFGGVLAAYFFLTLALVGASFFLVALCGSSKHGGHWLILLMFIAVWIPLIIFRIQGSTPVDAYASIDGLSKSPSGLFWINGNTVRMRQAAVVVVRLPDFQSDPSYTILATGNIHV